MAVNNAPGQHVLQIAKLIRLLNQDEIQELIRLVPQLQAEREVTADKRTDLGQWAREQMAQYETQAHPMQAKDLFLGHMSVEAYFNLPEAERERLWDELYRTAIETVKEREVKPDAVLSAG